MSKVKCDIYVQMSENRKLPIKEGVSLEEIALLMSEFFEKEENWHAMKECWLYKNKSEQFRILMKEAMMDAYDHFVKES